MSLGIKLEDKFIKVKPGLAASLEYTNSIFDDDLMTGDFALPIAIPYKENAATLKFLHEMHLKFRSTIYEGARLYFKKTYFEKGILDIIASDGNEVTASMRLNISGLTCMTTKLREFDYGGVRIFSEVGMVDVQAYYNSLLDITDTDFQFPMIYNPDFYGDNNAAFEGFMNSYNGGYLHNISGNRNCLVPMMYLHYIIRRAFAYDGYTVAGGFMDSAIMKKLIVYNNYAIDKLEYIGYANGLRAGYDSDTTGLTIGTYDFKPNNDATNGNYDSLSAYNTTNGNYTIQAAGTLIITVKLKAKISAGTNTSIRVNLLLSGIIIYQKVTNFPGPANAGFTHVFQAVGGDVGSIITATFDFINDNNFNSPQTLTMLANSLFQVNDLATPTNYNIYNEEIDLKNHVPDITFGDMLNALRKTFFIGVKPDHRNKIIYLEFDNDLFLQSYKSTAGKSVYSHKIDFNKDSVIRSLNFEFGGDDELTNDNFKTYDLNLYIGSFMSLNELNVSVPPGPWNLGRYAHIKNMNQIFRCNSPGLGSYSWDYFTDNFYDKIVDPEGRVDIRPSVCPLFMKEFFFENDYGRFAYILPQIKQPGSSPEFDLGNNDFGFKLLFYHGNDLTGGKETEFPFASSTGYTNFYTGATVGFENALSWDDFGLMQYAANYVALLSKGEFFTKKVRFDLIDLMFFDITQKFRIDNANWIVKNMRVDIGDKIGDAELTMLKILS